MASQKNNQDLSKIQHAHDHLFRESMQDIDIARQLSFLTLPSKAQILINWDTLEIVKEVWLDEKLKEHRLDVIYCVKALNDDQWVYLLFEHKSVPDKRIHFQLLRYILDIFDQHEIQNGIGKKLPLVIPLVVCHCNGPCKFDNSLIPDIAILGGIKEVIPDFRFLMLDLWLFNPEQMEEGSPTEAGAGKLKMLLLALKYSRRPEILSVLPQIIQISEKVQSDGYLYVVLTYLQSVIDDELKGRFREIVVEEHKDGEAIMKTIADSYREEGRKEKERELRKVIEQKDTVIEQKEEFVNQIVKRMIEKGMSLQSIQDITGLDNETIEKMVKKT